MNTNFNKLFLLLLIASAVFVGLKTLLPNKLFKTNTLTNTTNIVKDSLMLKAIEQEKNNIKKDSLLKPATTIVKDTIVKTETQQQPAIYLGHFYEKLTALEAGENTKIRIAYFGDSMNDGDLIVQDLRSIYQEKYGGNGVGFVNIYSESAKGRVSVIHSFSSNWKYNSFLKKQKGIKLGISGYVAFASDTLNTNWVQYSTYKIPLTNPTLFYGQTDSVNAAILINDKDNIAQKIDLNGKKLLNKIHLPSSNSRKLKITFETKNTPIYGISFDDNNGIYIDNFSCRGNSGLALSLLNGTLIKQFQEELKYDLIILQYGTNVISEKTKSYSWYRKSMERVIKNLQESFPETDILLMSVADKSKKYGTEMKTDSAIYKLLKEQQKTAIETNANFMNLYELMGGENSMVKWVEETPQKAQKDYTHFNSEGSKKIAQLIFNELENKFKSYKKSIVKDSISTIKKDSLP